MRQKKFPCCNEPMSEDDLFNAIDEGHDIAGVSSKIIQCPNCGKNLIVYLKVEDVEVEE